MGLVKTTYTDKETVISAKNLNDIQDAILDLEDGLFSIDNDKSGEFITITDAAKRGFRSLNVFGKTTQDGTPTHDAPADLVSMETPVVMVSRKNLIPFPYSGGTVTRDGVTFSVMGDGTIAMSGKSTKDTMFAIFVGSIPLKGKFTLSGISNTDGESSHYLQPYIDGNFQYALYNGSRTYDINGNLTALSLFVKSGKTINAVVRPQLESGSVATDYEQYFGQHLPTNRTLHGVPVASGGNYTDSNGQQWICDEIDFTRGVFVQRTKKVTVNGSSAENWAISGVQQVDGAIRFDTPIPTEPRAGQTFCLCNAYSGTNSINKYAETCWCNSTESIPSLEFRICTAYASTVEELKASLQANPVDFVYQLAAPIETPLSEEELAAYAALYTYKNHTTVSNDAGAYMELEYVMDAKKYIDGLMTGTIHPATVE